MVSAAQGRHRAPATAEAAAVDLGDLGACPADGSVVLTRTVDLLVSSVLAVSSDLDLRGVLRRTLASACLLTGAPHGMVAIEGERAILYGEHRGDRPLTASNGGLVAMVRVAQRPYARLRLAPPADGREFNARDELLVDRLVSAAGQAIGNALEHQRRHQGTDDAGAADAMTDAVRAERERIARDLHDTVIQRLFATGMRLQLLRRTAEEAAGAGITAAIRDLDATMRDLRATIYGLRRRHVSVLAQVQALVEEYAASLGFRPELRHSGPVDELLDGDLGDHVLATLREALSNVVKHARASAADVELHVSPAWTMLRVSDNGVGIPMGEGGVLGSGLANLRARAERLGGVLHLRDSRVEWVVPTTR